MKTVLLTFILIVNQPNGLTVPEARKAQAIAVQKLNTLTPYKFKSRLIRMRDPFPNEDNGVLRLIAWNNYFLRKKTRATYIHVLDVARDSELAGIAFKCQPVTKKNQVSISMQRFGDVGKSKITITAMTMAHEVAHQLGFDHVGIWGGKLISIMDEGLFAYRFVRSVKRFFFVDKPEVLDQMGCEVNHVG